MAININNMQRTLPQSYHVDTNRIRQHLQQADKSSAANQRQGDSVDISGEGRRALKKKCPKQGGWNRPGIWKSFHL